MTKSSVGVFMKLSRLLVLPVLMTVFSCSINAQVTEWQTDYEKAHTLNNTKQLPILLFFNGSDWSGCGMRMKHEVLDTSAFQEKIGSYFLCVEIDFPQHTALPEVIKTQNEALKNRFHIDEIPSLVILDPQERMITQIGYLPESGGQLAEDLLKIVEQDKQLVSGLNQLKHSSEELKQLYQIAQELGRQGAIEQILEKGLHTGDAFFLLEKYRLLVENGAMQSVAASALRKQIVSLQSQEIHFTLALIDFQQLAQNNTPPDSAVAPLVEYLDYHGKKDASNIWRIEMMMAQLYMEADQQEKALVHGERALQSAPEGMRDEIVHSLEYIRTAAVN